MTLKIRGILVSLAFLLLSPFLYSQDVLILKDEPNDSRRDPTKPSDYESFEADVLSTQPFVIFYRKWSEFEDAFEAGRVAEARELLSELVALRHRNDVPRLAGFALAVVQRGDAEVRRNRQDYAIDLYGMAIALDPALPQAYYRLSDLYARQGIGSWSRAASTAIEGFLAPRRSVTGKYYFNARLAILFFAGLLLAAICFSAVLLFRYLPLLKHDLSEKYSNADGSLINVLTAVILLLPVLLWIGPIWLAPFWLMLFIGYATRTEKVVAVCFLVTFAAAYPVYRRIIQTAQGITNPAVSAYVSVFSEGASPKALQDFQQYVAENPDDRDASIMLAYLYKANQRYIPAMELLQKHILDHPADTRAYNNLASLYFLQGETETALRLVQKALSLDHGCTLCRYNVAKLQRAKFNFAEADRLMQEARTLNPEALEALEKSSHQRLIDAVPGAELPSSRVAAHNDSSEASLLNPFTVYSVAMLMLAGLFTVVRSRRAFAKQCSKCGRPFCSKCHSGRDQRFCTQCLHIYIKKDGVSPISRKEKMREIERFSRSQHLFSKISSLIVPGAGSIYRRRTVFGVIVLILWMWLLVFALMTQTFSRFAFDPGEFSRTLITLCLLLMTFVYLIANLPILRRA